jgi:hypothetical protein
MSNDSMIDPILAMIAAAGLTPQDLINHATTEAPRPTTSITLSEYVAVVRRSLTEGTDDSYATHYNHLINGALRKCAGSGGEGAAVTRG